VSTGAQNDLQKITQMAYSSVAVYGMNDKIGLVSFPQDNQRMDKPYSDETARLIDEEARAIIKDCYEKTLQLLRDKTDIVEALAQVCCTPPGFLPSRCLVGDAFGSSPAGYMHSSLSCKGSATQAACGLSAAAQARPVQQMPHDAFFIYWPLHLHTSSCVSIQQANT
jgi:hypothetical protein